MCMLWLKLSDCFLCLMQVYVPNSSALYLGFVEETNDALQRVKTNKSIIILGYFKAHIRNDARIGCDWPT